MHALATWCFRRRRIVLGCWLVMVGVLFALSQAVGTNYSTAFSLPNTDSTTAANLLMADAPNLSGDTEQIVIAGNRGTTLTAPAERAQVEALLSKLSTLPDVTTVVSPYSAAGADQMNADHTVAFANLNYDKSADLISQSAAQSLVSTAQSFDTADLTVAVGGQVAESATSPSLSGIAFGILAAAIVLFLVFGSLLATTLPLLSALLALLAASSVTGMLSHAIGIPDLTTQLAPLIGLGVGVDYALFIVVRYRQGLQRGLDVETAVTTSVKTSGRAVLFAGVIVCIALVGMAALGIDVLTGIGIAASVTVLFTMATSLTLLPAMLGFLGERVLSRRQRARLHAGDGADPETGVWWRWSAWIARRRVVPALVSLAAVLVLAIPLLSMRLGSIDAGTDPAGTTTRQAYDLLSKGFGPGFNGPLLLTGKAGSSAEQSALNRVVAAVSHQDGVARVSQPMLLSGPAGPIAAIEVYPTTSPQSAATTHLIYHLRADVLPPAEAGSALHLYIGGDTATFADFAHVLGAKMPLFVIVVVLLSFLLLALMFRSLVIPATAAIMNLLSAGAALGVLSAVYVWGWSGSLLGGNGGGPIAAFLPAVIFAILFGLSMDYQVFLVSRIREEWLRTGDNAAAVRRGLAITGRTITAAAAIMILVFGSFILGGSVVIKQFGLGLAVAILVDAFFIRIAIVPAAMFLAGRSNWWFPRALERALPTIATEDSEDTAPAESADFQPTP